MLIIFRFVLLISIIWNIYAVNIQISNTFDPYRLECPDRFGVARITMQRMESVGGIRIDNMISVYCESLSKMFPSQRDFTETDLEKCRWTKYHEIPSNFEPSTTCHGEEFIAGIVRQESTMYGFLCCTLRDRKKKNCEQALYNWPSQDEPEVIVEKRPLLLTGFGFRNGQAAIEHCDYEVKSQSELDREFTSEAQRKLEKWKEAQSRRSSSTNPASSGSSEIGAPAFSSPGTGRTEPADFRSSNKFLAVFSNSEEARPSPPTPSFINRKSLTKKRKSFGPPGITPKGFKGTISPKIESTEAESEEEEEEKSVSTTLKPKRTKKPRLSSTKVPRRKKAKKLLKETRESETLSPSSSSSSQLSKEKSRKFSNEAETKLTTKSNRKTKLTTMSPTSASKSNENDTKIEDKEAEEDEEENFKTTTKTFSPTTKIFPLKSVEKSAESVPADANFTVKMSDVKKLSQFMSKSAEKKNTTLIGETRQPVPKSSSLENSDREVIYIDFPSGSTDTNFERKTATLFDKSDVEVEYLYFDEIGNPVTPPPKNASVQLKSVTVEIQHENSDDESKILESKDNDEHKIKEISDVEKVEQSKITKNATSTTPKSRKTNGASVKISTTKSPVVAKATTTIIATKKFSTTTTKRPPRRRCTKDVAAVHHFSGEILACGQGSDVWVPQRCPKNTACLPTEDSNYRLCCPF